MDPRRLRVCCCAFVVTLAASCLGVMKESRPPTDPCAVPEPGPAPLRRLSSAEYDNTIQALLGDDSRPSKVFPGDPKSLGFTNNIDSQTVSAPLAHMYVETAARLAAEATAGRRLQALVPCEVARGDLACADRFIETWGRRAWRRPLEPAERAALRRMFEGGAAAGGFPAGIQMVIQNVLQAPQFIYHVELGGPGAPGAVVMRTPWELAARLAYLLWGGPPDAELERAAGEGRLATADNVAAQAGRMLADPRARAAIHRFYGDWLELETVEKISSLAKLKLVKNGAPAAALHALFRREIDLMVEYSVWSAPDGIAALLAAPVSSMSPRLATLYGLGEPLGGPTPDAFVTVRLDGVQRLGFLTTLGFLAGHAKSTDTDPVHRGKFVREQMFCQVAPPPPDDVEIEPPDPDPGLTTRERFEDHRADVGCGKCHRLMDPIGLAFENYDAAGRWRTLDNGRPVDASGELVNTDVDGPFYGAVELARRTARSGLVRRCFVTQWFRFAAGRSESPRDACSLRRLEQAFTTSGHDVRALLVALTQSDAFLYLRKGALQP